MLSWNSITSLSDRCTGGLSIEFIIGAMPLATRWRTMRSMLTSIDQSRSLAFHASVLPFS
ncbi:hypothetical protein D3C83_234890 [compost metagenome]